MRKIVKSIELEKFSIEADLVEGMYDDSIDNSKMNNNLGYDVAERYKEGKKALKEKIIKALKECDDFEVDYSECDHWGRECELVTYKIEVESDTDLEKRKKKASDSAKISAKKRKLNKELKDKEDYERLSKKFAKNN